MVGLKSHLCAFGHKRQGSLTCVAKVSLIFKANLAMLLERESSFRRLILSLRDFILCLIIEIRQLNEGMLAELQAI